jgi:hypothetical protein
MLIPKIEAVISAPSEIEADFTSFGFRFLATRNANWDLACPHQRRTVQYSAISPRSLCQEANGCLVTAHTQDSQLYVHLMLIPSLKILNRYSVELIPKQNPLLSAQKVTPVISGFGFS